MNESDESHKSKLEELHAREAELRHRGDYRGALVVLDQMIALDNNYSPAFNNKGAILMMFERYEEALPSFERAISLDPANAQAYNNYGLCLFNTGRAEEAISWYREAQNRGYTHEGVNYNLGKALLARGRLGEALDEWEIAMRKNPLYQKVRAEVYQLAQAFGVVVPGDHQIDDSTVEKIREAVADYKVMILATEDSGELQILIERKEQA